MPSEAIIAPLPAQVVAQIKSSICITSLNTVIVELVKNSLDAPARKIIVQVEASRGRCVVEDDGLGIPPAEFQRQGGLAKLHHTSKHASTAEAHGSHGCFLASLSALSLLSIISHHHLHHSTNSLTLARSEIVSRQTPVSQSQNALSSAYGTRVVVRNLFGDMPVRVKQRALESADPLASNKEWDELRKELTHLVLAWPFPVTLSVKEVSSSARPKAFKLSSSPRQPLKGENLCSHISSLLYQAKFISDPTSSTFVSASGHTSSVKLNGAICLDPAPNKSMQFIAFGISPVVNTEGRNVLYEEINRLFANSNFGQLDDLPMLDEREKKRRAEDRRYKSDGFTGKELKGGGKGVDRWPIFFMRIDIMGSRDSGKRLAEDDVLEDEAKLNSIIKLVQAVVVEWLKSNHFVPKHIPRQKSPKKRGVDEMTGSDMKRHGSTPTSVSKSSRSRGEMTDTVANSLLMETGIGSGSSIRPASPFDIWPRVKSGRTITRSPYMKDPRQLEQNALDETRGPLATPVQTPLASKTTETPQTVSKAGLVVRLPFLDLETPPTSRKSRTPKPPTPVPTPPIPPSATEAESNTSATVPTVTEQQEKDEIISWINPANKQESFINKRTGLMVSKPHISRTTSSERSLTQNTSFNTRLTAPHLPSNPLASSRPQSPFVTSLLSTWNNPVFALSEPPISLASNPSTDDTSTHAILHGQKHNCTQHDISRAFSSSSSSSVSGSIGRLTKAGLARAEVVRQVDGKFILVKMPVKVTEEGEGEEGEVLVLIDQHAADERVRVEGLLCEFFLPPENYVPALVGGNEGLVPGVRTKRLEVPMRFDIDILEGQKLEERRRWFAGWGIVCVVRRVNEKVMQVVVTDLPPAIVERCKMVPKLLIELIRKELHNPSSSSTCITTTIPQPPTANKAPDTANEAPAWLKRIHNLPPSLLEMINSRACRSAVMFNDALTVEESEELVGRLAKTCFPFICAHGRPGCVPLVELGGVGGWEGDVDG